MDQSISCFIGISFKNTDDLHYFDSSSVIHDLSLSYKNIFLFIQHLLRNKQVQLFRNLSVIKPSVFDAILQDCGIPPIHRVRIRKKIQDSASRDFKFVIEELFL